MKRTSWNTGLTKETAPQLSNSGVKKGNIPWNKGIKTGIVPKSAFKKGRKLPEADKERNRDLLSKRWDSGEFIGTTGMKFSLETRRKISEANRGANNYNWKGGITTENLKFRRSFEYRIWREAVYARDDYTCQNCHVRGVELNADHIKPFSQYPELRLAIDNGRTLCVSCHRKIGWNTYQLTKAKIDK